MKLIFYLVMLRFFLRIFPASLYAGAMIREDLEKPREPKDGEEASTKEPPDPEG